MFDKKRDHFDFDDNPMQNTYYSFKNMKNAELKQSKNSRNAFETEPDINLDEEYNNSSIL